MGRLLAFSHGALRSQVIIKFQCAALLLAACLGCGSGDALPMKIVEGNVTCGNVPVEGGIVRFVPIEGTRGPMSFGTIDHGKYRVETHGGVPLGTHRVEVEAWKKTGRTVAARGRFETQQEDEHERLGPAEYAVENSPLRLQLTAASSDRFDIKLPAQ